MRPAIGCLAALSPREQVEAFHAFSDTGADRGCSRLNTRVDPLDVRQL